MTITLSEFIVSFSFNSKVHLISVNQSILFTVTDDDFPARIEHRPIDGIQWHFSVVIVRMHCAIGGT